MDKNKKSVILFVDDDRSILSALRRQLRKEEWRLLFAASGAEGLKILKEQQVNLVVSDVRMPGMDGVAILSRIKEDYPHVVRIILSGFADKEMVTRAFSQEIAQQFLTKPWGDQEIRDVLRSALSRTGELKRRDSEIQQVINSISSLPALPANYLELRAALDEASGKSMDEVVTTLQKDPAISVKLLHWANSAMFGQVNRVKTVERAVVLLGMDLLSGLLLSMAAFDALPCTAKCRFNLRDFQNHCFGCAKIAREMTGWQTDDKKQADNAFTAALLHDVGRLVFCSYLPEQFDSALSLAGKQKRPLTLVEQEIFATDHAEIGFHLAKWWDLPDVLAHSIRFHHEPREISGPNKIILAAVHVADGLIHQFPVGSSSSDGQQIDKACWGLFSPTPEQMAQINLSLGRK